MGEGILSTEITNVSTILSQKGLCDDTGPLQKVIGELKKSQSYNLQRLEIKIDKVPNNTRPSNIKLLKAILTVQISENICSDTQIQNPVNSCNFSVELSGKNEKGDTVHSNWHLDFDNSDTNEYIHPAFHLTYGGNVMKNTELGNVLLLPTPRIPYPPMDAILGIDFVLSNFIKKDVYNKIKVNSQYMAAVKRSQQRLWRPYMLALAKHWCDFKNCSHYVLDNSFCKKLHPTIVD